MKEGSSSNKEYFQKLEHWVKQSKLLQNATACFPYYLASNYPNCFIRNGVNVVQDTDEANTRTTNLSRPETSQVNNNQHNGTPSRISSPGGGYEFVIAPLWKRFFAEMVDVALLLLLKVAITFTFLNIFDLDLSYEFDSDYLKKSVTEEDSKFLSLSDLLTLSSDLVALEILMKIFVCLYEALWTMSGRIFVGGATPGKLLLRLRIVYVEVISLPNGAPLINGNGEPVRALIYPAENPGFRRAFLRAIVKNLVLALLFPICFVFLFLKNNRTFYDVLAKTVVVEENPAPILRRQ